VGAISEHSMYFCVAYIIDAFLGIIMYSKQQLWAWHVLTSNQSERYANICY